MIYKHKRYIRKNSNNLVFNVINSIFFNTISVVKVCVLSVILNFFIIHNFNTTPVNLNVINRGFCYDCIEIFRNEPSTLVFCISI